MKRSLVSKLGARNYFAWSFVTQKHYSKGFGPLWLDNHGFWIPPQRRQKAWHPAFSAEDGAPRRRCERLCPRGVSISWRERAGNGWGEKNAGRLSCLLDWAVHQRPLRIKHRFCNAATASSETTWPPTKPCAPSIAITFRELRPAPNGNRPATFGFHVAREFQSSRRYRESVVRISLSALAAIAFGQPSGGAMDD